MLGNNRMKRIFLYLFLFLFISFVFNTSVMAENEWITKKNSKISKEETTTYIKKKTDNKYITKKKKGQYITKKRKGQYITKKEKKKNDIKILLLIPLYLFI